MFKLIACSMLLLTSASSFSQKGENQEPLHLGASCEFSAFNLCYGDTTNFVNHTLRMMNPTWEISDSTGILLADSSIDLDYKFPYPGIFRVKLKADNGHPDSITKLITVDSITMASFSFQQCSQRFINISTCAYNFMWNFGDGDTSTLPDPIHLYSDTGMYSVKLIVSNGSVRDSITANIKVLSRGFTTGQFTYNQSNDTVFFFGDTIANNYNWDFGDNNFSSIQNPFNVYSDSGYYLINSIVSNYCGLKIYSEWIYIFPATAVNEYKSEYKSLIVTPNPVYNSHCNIAFNGFSMQKNSVLVYDIFGKEIYLNHRIQEHSITLFTSLLTKGVYFIKILDTDNNLYHGKLIVN